MQRETERETLGNRVVTLRQCFCALKFPHKFVQIPDFSSNVLEAWFEKTSNSKGLWSCSLPLKRCLPLTAFILFARSCSRMSVIFAWPYLAFVACLNWGSFKWQTLGLDAWCCDGLRGICRISLSLSVYIYMFMQTYINPINPKPLDIYRSCNREEEETGRLELPKLIWILSCSTTWRQF